MTGVRQARSALYESVSSDISFCSLISESPTPEWALRPSGFWSAEGSIHTISQILRTLPMTLFGRLNEAAERVMREHMNPLFAEAGLQPGEFDVLATLRRSGEPFMLSPTRLYEATMISSGGMTDRLDRLERAGLVVRRPDPKDRRGKLIVLTETGKRLVDGTLSRHVANEERLLLLLTQAEQETLDALLKKLIAAL